MKKIYRRSQIHSIAGPFILGLEMHKYGLPYNGAAGCILPHQHDLIDLMLAAVERHPELHVVTGLLDGTSLNRFHDSNVLGYSLHLGNPDPEIEFSTEWSLDDFPEDDDEGIDYSEEPLTTVQIAAINWIMEEARKASKARKK